MSLEMLEAYAHLKMRVVELEISNKSLELENNRLLPFEKELSTIKRDIKKTLFLSIDEATIFSVDGKELVKDFIDKYLKEEK